MKDLILYNYFRSSASYRVRVALYLKKLPFEYKSVHLVNNGGEQFGGEYSKLNPSREVPTLIHKGRALAQSMAIIEYLDYLQPSPRLFPEDPFVKAQVQQVCEIVNSGIQPLQNLRVLKQLETQFHADQNGKNEWTAKWIRTGFAALENLLQTSATKYSFGDELTAADLFIVPQIHTAARFNVGCEDYPTISRINANCLELEAFRLARPETQPDTPAELKQNL